MTELLTAAQMRQIEQAAIDSGAVTGLELMERAGAGVVEAVFEEWPDLGQGAHRAVVLCGPGNNGGDGFVVARLLHERGWDVEVFFFGQSESLSPDARAMHDRWTATGEILPMEPGQAGQGPRPVLLVDAMFGTGLTRPIPLICAQAFQAVTQRKRVSGTTQRACHVVAVDAPSGMDMDSGEVLYPNFQDEVDSETFLQREVYPRNLTCGLCVTFHRAKRGHYLAKTGRRAPVVVDIGLPEGPSSGNAAFLAGALDDPARIRLIDPEPGRSRKLWLRHVAHLGAGGHKYDRGHTLILGGGVGRGGAARMAARAALRVGAGLVTLAVPPAAVQENAAQLNAIMLCPVGGADELRAMLEDTRLSCVVLGPGLGVGAKTRELVLAALNSVNRRVVLDADALSSFADDPEPLFEALGPSAVLTPHEGEFARLFPDLSESAKHPSLAAPPMSRIDAAQAAAARCGATVLLKGPATVIASPDGTTGLHPALYHRAAPWLGTAGAGDVLAGMIGGLLAHPMAEFGVHKAVEAAAWLHVEAARSFGPGLIAEDLPEELPKVFRALGL
ncbi:NAD(P)H-hydrate dehydratase [uncultured Mameliella sp.]|uniref:NAD(P)H-hydrate dehydratase n=1 Tax=uncultured Mameliella sp. TaxID=1447087 RepID=UPI0026307FAA|nr:NAD(P)H-hydrate dehydratase [uncultured Mameliella sp.]